MTAQQSQAAAENTTDIAPPPVRSERRGAVAVLTLDRPAKRNALSAETLQALIEAVQALRDDPAVRAVIIAHAGPVFSSGHDIRAMVGAADAAVRDTFELSSSLMSLLHSVPKPVIAQVEGLASAAGLQLAASCDLIVAAETATFQTPGVMIGLFCSTPMVPLSRAVPSKKALEMLFTGRPISAREAERYGLVNRVVPPERLAAETMALAEEIIQYSAYTLALGKAAFYKQLPLPESEAYAVGCEAMAVNAMADDAQEGMGAFLEKRPPRFKQ